ncbi:hypothetical protein Z517_00915 [Fonsecaea pedrosoi CBS 271.37]|uniref:Zn(2)-C6 fungal-type domain-containing protein n=1 Tax=Fonsecaea pedrosoi CBS 271.37 TaxID=1442368 RepID=A0A0D2GX11_9EURO|nr:uncharacterized protein Z517_00915 [Fonsecaea pedrosoi CBS 271.37]KIW85523.1 hypothetical protein Z517_00915 [Fonsecaea pedrosoi CBS 271.37]
MDTPQDGDDPQFNSAPYGRACLQCARAKCRCIQRGPGLDCERCRRLGKQCVPGNPRRRHNGRCRPPSRTARLENKLDELVNVLRNQRHHRPGAGNFDTATSDSSPAFDTEDLDADHERRHDAVAQSHTRDSRSRNRIHPPPISQGADRAIPTDKSSSPTFNYPIHPVCESHTTTLTSRRGTHVLPAFYSVTPAEAEQCLGVFRSQHLEFMPFVHLPPTVTASQLRETRPFLWYNIMTVATPVTSLQLAWSEAIQKKLAQDMFVENERSVDLLLGLLVYLSWSHFYKKRGPNISLLCSLAMSLVFDLGLNRASREGPGGDGKTMDECRAVLACFYITSQISLTMKRIDGLNWTPYMERCLETLATQPEWHLDGVLVAQVRLQLLLDDINRNSWSMSAPSSSLSLFSSSSSHTTAAAMATATGPSAFYVSAILAQIRAIEKELTPDLKNNHILLAQLRYTELITHETTIQLAGPFNTNINTKPDHRRHHARRDLVACLGGFFDALFALPATAYAGMSFPFWCQLGHCLLTLHGVVTVERDLLWDGGGDADNRIDLLDICDRLISSLDEVSSQRKLLAAYTSHSTGIGYGDGDGDCNSGAGPGAEVDTFTLSGRMIRSMKSVWTRELAAMTADVSSSSTTTTTSNDSRGGGGGGGGGGGQRNDNVDCETDVPTSTTTATTTTTTTTFETPTLDPDHMASWVDDDDGSNLGRAFLTAEAESSSSFFSPLFMDESWFVDRDMASAFSWS